MLYKLICCFHAHIETLSKTRRLREKLRSSLERATLGRKHRTHGRRATKSAVYDRRAAKSQSYLCVDCLNWGSPRTVTTKVSALAGNADLGIERLEIANESDFRSLQNSASRIFQKKGKKGGKFCTTAFLLSRLDAEFWWNSHQNWAKKTKKRDAYFWTVFSHVRKQEKCA